jgi:hypothetical protein
VTAQRSGRRRRGPRTQVHPRLTAELGKRLRDFAKGKGASHGSVVQDALTAYFDGSSDSAVVLRRLDRLYRYFARVQRDVNVLAEAFSVYVQVWLAHTPRIEEPDRAKAESTALARFEQFAEHVATRVGSGKWMLDELARRGAPGDTDASEPQKGGDES